MAKITINNIKQFIEGNTNLLYDAVIGKPKYYQEQIVYRASKCSDCLEDGKCVYCGCDLPGKHYVKKSCNNGERFPDLMDEKEWEEFKEKNKIEIYI